MPFCLLHNAHQVVFTKIFFVVHHSFYFWFGNGRTKTFFFGVENKCVTKIKNVYVNWLSSSRTLIIQRYQQYIAHPSALAPYPNRQVIQNIEPDATKYIFHEFWSSLCYAVGTDSSCKREQGYNSSPSDAFPKQLASKVSENIADYYLAP